MRYIIAMALMLTGIFESPCFAAKELAAASASLATIWSDYQQGYVRMRVVREAAAFLDAEIEYTWDSKTIVLNVIRKREAYLDEAGKEGIRDCDPYKAIYGQTETWVYYPSREVIDGTTGLRKQRIVREFDVSPRSLWLSWPWLQQKRIDSFFTTKYAGKGNPLDGGLWEFGGAELRVVVDEASAYLPVLIENLVHIPEEKRVTPMSSKYHWKKTDDQLWICDNFVFSEMSPDLSVLSSTTYHVLEYRKHVPPGFSPSIDGLHAPKGTKVYLSGDKSKKTWTFGEEANATKDVDKLRELIERVQQRGFAKPKE